VGLAAPPFRCGRARRRPKSVITRRARSVFLRR